MAFLAAAPIIAAGVSAAGGIAGGMLGASGQASTNAAQIAASNLQQQQANTFNAQQGDINRDFSNVQAQDQRNWAQTMSREANVFSDEQATRARDFQQQSVESQERFQERMYDRAQNFNEQMANTAWQRGVADMKAAGINPILAANLGGASSPTMGGASGASASSPSPQGALPSSGIAGAPGAAGSPALMPQLGNPAAALQHGITSAAQAGKLMADVKATLQQADKDEAQTKLNEASQGLTKQLEDKARQDTVTSAKQGYLHDANAGAANQTAINAAISNAILKEQVTSAAARARIDAREAADVERYGPGPYGQAGAAGSRISSTVVDWILKNWRSIPSNSGGGVYGPKDAPSGGSQYEVQPAR